jgi:hypothetical protein
MIKALIQLSYCFQKCQQQTLQAAMEMNKNSQTIHT